MEMVGLGYAEIDNLGQGFVVLRRYQNVGRLQIAVNDSFLVGVMQRAAYLDEEIDAGPDSKAVLVGEFEDLNPFHQFHDQERTSSIGGTCVQHFGDVRVIHHRQHLAFRFETGQKVRGIHAHFEDLDRNLAVDVFRLASDPNRSPSALSNAFEQLIASDLVAGAFVRRSDTAESRRYFRRVLARLILQKGARGIV